MPEIDKENLGLTYGRILEEDPRQVLFIRSGNRICWDSMFADHHEVLRRESLPEPQDAGYLFASFTPPTNKRMAIAGDSASLGVPKNQSDREETFRILEKMAENTGIRIDFYRR